VSTYRIGREHRQNLRGEAVSRRNIVSGHRVYFFLPLTPLFSTPICIFLWTTKREGFLCPRPGKFRRSV